MSHDKDAVDIIRGTGHLDCFIGDAEAGVDRLVDALVGAATALVFSQLLFTPEPVALVRRAESAALEEMAAGLELTAKAMATDDEGRGEEAMDRLRALRDELTELARTRAAGKRIVRRAAAWRSQRAPVVREVENAGHLDLLGGSCLMLARVCLAAGPDKSFGLRHHVHDLADALVGLASDPGDLTTRQRAADRALAVARACGAARPSDEPSVAAAIALLDLTATDVMIFAGVDPDQAAAAVRKGTGALKVPTPPPVPRLPFRRES